MGACSVLLALLLLTWLQPWTAIAGGAKQDFWGIPLKEPLPLHEFEELDDTLPLGIALSTPSSGEHFESAVALVEVKGQIEVGGETNHDLVLAIDSSGSVFLPTGSDIDGDGKIGELRCNGRLCGRPRRWTTDYEDSVLNAELIAARSLVELLDPERTRMGIIKFGRTADVYKDIRKLQGIPKALKKFPRSSRAGTDLITAIDQCIQMLQEVEPRPGGFTMRSAILLSDGAMIFQVQSEETAAEEAAEYLRQGIERARAAGVRVFTFAIGPDAAEHPRVMRYIAESTGGRYTGVPDPAAVLTELPMVSLSELSDVELVNMTSGDTGRAIRVFPGGSFDGFVPLVAGPNQLRVAAALLDGTRLEHTIELTYIKPATASAADLEEQRKLLDRLKLRTVETDLARRAQVERRKRRLDKQLTIETEEQAPKSVEIGP